MSYTSALWIFVIFPCGYAGLPEAPNITFNRSSDKSYFSISITPTDPAAVCVQQYNLTFINETGSVLQYNVSANDATFDSRSVSFADLGTCIATLDLQVVAILGGGVASQNDIMLFTGKLTFPFLCYEVWVKKAFRKQ